MVYKKRVDHATRTYKIFLNKSEPFHHPNSRPKYFYIDIVKQYNKTCHPFEYDCSGQR